MLTKPTRGYTPPNTHVHHPKHFSPKSAFWCAMQHSQQKGVGGYLLIRRHNPLQACGPWQKRQAPPVETAAGNNLAATPSCLTLRLTTGPVPPTAAKNPQRPLTPPLPVPPAHTDYLHATCPHPSLPPLPLLPACLPLLPLPLLPSPLLLRRTVTLPLPPAPLLLLLRSRQRQPLLLLLAGASANQAAAQRQPLLRRPAPLVIEGVAVLHATQAVVCLELAARVPLAGHNALLVGSWGREGEGVGGLVV